MHFKYYPWELEGLQFPSEKAGLKLFKSFHPLFEHFYLKDLKKSKKSLKFWDLVEIDDDWVHEVSLGPGLFGGPDCHVILRANGALVTKLLRKETF